MLNLNNGRWIARPGIPALVLAVALSGCSSWINPHVTWDRKQSAAQIDLHNAIDYAQRAIDKYKDAAGDQATLTTVMGLGLIPLGAAALGFGITGGNPNIVTALGLGGAAGYASGSWLSSKDRQLIYIEGMKAMSCAIGAVQPLNIPRNEIKTDLDKLNAAIIKVERDIGSVKDVEEYKASPMAKQNVTTAEALLTQSRTTRDEGTKLLVAHSQAGITLVNAVDRIGAEVDKAIAGTLQSLDALPGIIGSLSDLSTQFAKPAEAPAAPPKPSVIRTEFVDPALKEPLKSLLKALKESSKVLASREQAIADVIRVVLEADVANALKSCNVTDVATAFTVQPAGPIEMKKAAGGNKRLVITGGKPPYTAELLEAPVEGLRVTQPVPLGPRVLIEVTATKVTVADYNVYVSDATGKSQTVVIRITE